MSRVTALSYDINNINNSPSLHCIDESAAFRDTKRFVLKTPNLYQDVSYLQPSPPVCEIKEFQLAVYQAEH